MRNKSIEDKILLLQSAINDLLIEYRNDRQQQTSSSRIGSPSPQQNSSSRDMSDSLEVNYVVDIDSDRYY